MTKILNKKISISYVFFVLPLFFFLFIHYSNQVEDIWFLLAHGRYVINHGIPHTEILTIHKGLHFVMQQWAFSTVLYLIYHYLGNLGISICLGICNLLLIIFLYKTCLVISNNNKYFSCLITAIIDLLLELNFIIPRPQIISLLLLIITLYLLELYLNNNSNKIYLLPIVSIIFINIHASTWPMMFIFCLPFVVEFIYLYFKKKDKRLFKLFVVMFISFLVALINPYGIEAITYSFNSYGVSLINQTIAEMHSFALDINNRTLMCNSLLILSFIITNIVFIIKNYRKLPIHYYFFFLGLSIMALLNLRNISFLLIGTFPFLTCCFNKKIKYKISIKIYIVIAIILSIIFIINYSRGFYNIKNTKVNEIVNYLDNNSNKKAIIFTCFNDGAYFEYNGYKVYMDSRAEVFLKSNNKKEDIFNEYYNVLIGNINYDKFIDKYKFTHFVVPKDSYFENYLEKNNNYQKVFEQEDMYLYEIKDYSS